MERGKWTFGYKAEDLIEPAHAKRALHLESYEHWKVELEAARVAKGALEEADDESFDEQASGRGAYTSQLRMDTPQQRIDDAKDKVRNHLAAAEQFARFIRAFETHRSQMVELGIEDIEYFGL